MRKPLSRRARLFAALAALLTVGGVAYGASAATAAVTAGAACATAGVLSTTSTGATAICARTTSDVNHLRWRVVTGARGATGPAGPQGVQGPAGPVGPQGAPGKDGVLCLAGYSAQDVQVQGVHPALIDVTGLTADRDAAVQAAADAAKALALANAAVTDAQARIDAATKTLNDPAASQPQKDIAFAALQRATADLATAQADVTAKTDAKAAADAAVAKAQAALDAAQNANAAPAPTFTIRTCVKAAA